MRVALITGGSRGIGAAIAKRLAQDGLAVAITYSSSPAKADEVVKSIEAAGGKALAIQADAADEAATRAAVQQTVKHFGQLDVLVNNAAIARMAPVTEFKIEDLDLMLNTNIRGVFIASQEAARHLPEGGRIINIGSVNSDALPFQGGSVYSLTKSALVGLTKGLARDLGPRGITVNNVQPGPVDTDMNPDSGPFAEQAKGIMALGRYGRVEEISSFVSYLASPAAAYITGAGLTIDGGYGI